MIDPPLVFVTDSCLCSEPKLRIPDLAQNRDWRVSWSHFAPQAKKITSFRDYPTRLLANMIFPRLCLSGELGLCRLMLIHHEFQPEANTLITLVKETMILERVTITIWLIDSFTLPHEFIQDWVLPQACQNYNPKIILSAIKADPRLDPDHKSQDFYDTPRRMVPSSSTGERILAELKPPSTWESIVGAWRRWRERN